MIYLMRLIVWLIIIFIISGVIGKLTTKLSKGKIRGWIVGLASFFIIVLAPITIAKTAQLYYCWKYQPFYKIVKPLGDDFEGYYKELGDQATYSDLSGKKYPEIIDFLDIPLKDKYLKTIGYGRYYFDKYGSSNCVTEPDNSSHMQALRKKQEKYAKEGKCLAFKEIPESEVSRYIFGGTIEYSKPFMIPGLVKVIYHKAAIFSDRKTGEPYAWAAFIGVNWDLYWAFNWWGGGYSFSCGSKLGLKDKMIKNRGE